LISFIAAVALLGGCGAIVDRRADTRESLAEATYPPTGQLVEVNGRTVHAHIEGRGPDLVLIHGASGNTRDFTFSLAQFALAMHMVQPAGFLLLRRGRRVVWVALEALQDETI